MPDPCAIPEPVVADWVRDEIGPFEVLSTFGHLHGYSKLWRLSSGVGPVWLKMHARLHKWAGELHALTRWTPELGLCPRVIAWRTEPQAILLEECRGVDAEQLELGSAQEERLWSEAGRWLAEMHQRENDWFGGLNPDGSAFGESSVDPEDFVWRTFDRRIQEGREMGVLSVAEMDFIERAGKDSLPSLKGERPIAIHRDFTPRNWLTNRVGTLKAVIDFEHSRWDVRASDLNRPWDYEFLRNPRLERAFYEGYGPMTERLKEQIFTLRLQQSAAGIVWGLQVGEVDYSHRNREALHRLMKVS